MGVQINLASVSLRSAFLRLLREPLERMKQPSGLVVVIDALDESEEGTGSVTFASLLGLEMATPVPGLRLLVTTRPGRALDHVSQWPRFDLIDDEPAAGRDVFVYVGRRLSPVSDDAWRPLAERISVESRGNFLYARHVVDHAVRSGFAASALAASLPSTLADLYRGFLLREVAHGPLAWQERFRPLLGALCQALGDGLTRAHLVAISRLSEEEVDDTLALCRPYLAGDFPLGRSGCTTRR